MTTDDRVHLTVEQALAMLPDGESIHTLRGGNGMMLGADWNRSSVEKAIRETDHRELSGHLATSMSHGLCIKEDGRALYIETVSA